MFNLEIYIKSAVQLYQSTTVPLNHPTTLPYYFTLLLYIMAHFSCTVLGVLRLTPGIAHTLQEKQVHQKEVPESYVINFLLFNKIGAKLIKL